MLDTVNITQPPEPESFDLEEQMIPMAAEAPPYSLSEINILQAIERSPHLASRRNAIFAKGLNVNDLLEVVELASKRPASKRPARQTLALVSLALSVRLADTEGEDYLFHMFAIAKLEELLNGDLMGAPKVRVAA